MLIRVAFAHKPRHKILGIFKPCDVICIMNDMAIPVMEFQKREYKIIFLPKKEATSMYYLSYGVKFNGEIDIVQFIFTLCVVYTFSEYLFVAFSFNYKKYQ